MKLTSHLHRMKRSRGQEWYSYVSIPVGTTVGEGSRGKNGLRLKLGPGLHQVGRGEELPCHKKRPASVAFRAACPISPGIISHHKNKNRRGLPAGKTQLAWCGCNFCLMGDVYRKKGNVSRQRDTSNSGRLCGGMGGQAGASNGEILIKIGGYEGGGDCIITLASPYCSHPYLSRPVYFLQLS